jgi:hypothetical protein
MSIRCLADKSRMGERNLAMGAMITVEKDPAASQPIVLDHDVRTLCQLNQ